MKTCSPVRELWPDAYHNVDILDEGGRMSLIQRRYYNILSLKTLEKAAGLSHFQTIGKFLESWDLLHEYDQADFELPTGEPPVRFTEEQDWCKEARLNTTLGTDSVSDAMSTCLARFYAYLRCRRFLDFSSSQTEFVNLLRSDPDALKELQNRRTHVVVDEVQDINPVQNGLIRLLVGDEGCLTAVGDHRQAIYGWRGARIDLMAELNDELREHPNGDVMRVPANFRSTPRVLDLANEWSETVGTVGDLENPAMRHGNQTRDDYDSAHVGHLHFGEREEEAEWIARTIEDMVVSESEGAVHDAADGRRGVSFSDIAILLRSSGDARTYAETLKAHDIPVIFQAGPDLFSQPEVLLFLGALGRMAGMDEFMGNSYIGLPAQIKDSLACAPHPGEVIYSACEKLAEEGLMEQPWARADRISYLCARVRDTIFNQDCGPKEEDDQFSTPGLRQWLSRDSAPRRVFPQVFFHWLLSEGGVRDWDSQARRAETALFHLGQMSSLVTSLETPGWTTPQNFKSQIIALSIWGARNARSESDPLLSAPDAVTISTIHKAKGREWPAVFLADVKACRFPSNKARQDRDLLLPRDVVDPDLLSDNENFDQERRLMYVGLTRAERYLWISAGGKRQSRFSRRLKGLVGGVGGQVWEGGGNPEFTYAARTEEGIEPLVTSFSDLRYFLECPHDFYLRKALGFAPTIDQAFGYGRGVHNLLRAVHSDPVRWAELAEDPERLEQQADSLVHDTGLFYLRYTTGKPEENMRRNAARIVRDYVGTYSDELASLEFEPEKEFETLLSGEDVLISGAIDLIRLDDPPRVALVDFKSGEADSDQRMKLDENQMRLQISLYGLAAKNELEYEPDEGLVRYLGEKEEGERELRVDLSPERLRQAGNTMTEVARSIRERGFDAGPRKGHEGRCSTCDFLQFRGRPEAVRARSGRS
jgi:DNA helicase-2/ATP-dependent DNA helicase PcrA